MKRSLIILLLPVLVGCKSRPGTYTPTPPPKVEPVANRVTKAEEVLPLTIGNTWTYQLKAEEYQGNKRLGEATQTVLYRVTTVNGNRALLELIQGDNVVDRQSWENRPDGLYQLTTSLKNVPYKPAQIAAPLPLEKGKRFNWVGSGMMPDSSMGAGKAVSEVMEPEPVDTAMGTLSAIPVTTVTTFKTGRCDNTTWFRPGVGLIRLRQETTTNNGRRSIITLILTNYALKRS
ncbi:hypothetical protein EON82_00015 [bacterium]|nr:MAG: hypothetical protein EON82_00015 [bacterium]